MADIGGEDFVKNQRCEEGEEEATPEDNQGEAEGEDGEKDEASLIRRRRNSLPVETGQNHSDARQAQTAGVRRTVAYAATRGDKPNEVDAWFSCTLAPDGSKSLRCEAGADGRSEAYCRVRRNEGRQA